MKELILSLEVRKTSLMKDGQRRIWPRVGIHQAETGKRILFRENCRCEDLEEGKREGGIREEEKERAREQMFEKAW